MKPPLAPVTTSILDLPLGWFVLSYVALANNRLGILATNKDIYGALKKDHNAAQALLKHAHTKIWIFDGKTLNEDIFFSIHSPFPKIDQFPDGRWLIEDSCSSGHKNARILRPDGSEERRIKLGKGINHLKIDNKNQIWVGWHDQGVFGNDDWKLQGHKWPSSSNGIACFDDLGGLVKSASSVSIADCYALNIFDDEAWSCFYTDFPIWNMKGVYETTWPSELSGTSAIAVSYPYVLAAGGYLDNKNSMHLIKLTKNNAVTEISWKTDKISDNDEIRLLDGRANSLHLVTNNKWYRWNVNDCVQGK